MENEMILTSDGKKALEEKLEKLKNVTRKEVSERMKEAVSHGDLSENAEYDQARNDHLRLDAEIDDIETMLARAKVLDEKNVNTDKVDIGSLVEIKGNGEKKSRTFRIVGPTETDPNNGKMSYKCPMGKAMMGKKAGDVVNVLTPGGQKKYEIVSIGK
jgi:transcription elongation factor GreA